jgi:hypothetical protein
MFNIKFPIHTAGVSSEKQKSFSKKCLKFSKGHILDFTSGVLADSNLDFTLHANNTVWTRNFRGKIGIKHS